ncbi:hypothetical protein [Tenacibaculum sp.]|uniref:hypothetical protein n=1 Tax=Tenacibaculum sp. TaxID=1906242 RepID=UPI003AA9D69D
MCSGSGGGSGGAGAEGTWIVILYPDSYTNKSSNTKKGSTENCCDDTVVVGEIGVNFFDLAIKIKNALNISGRSQEGLWLTAYATDTQLAELNNYIENNKDSNGGLSPEEQELGKSIIEVLRVGNTSEKELANAFLNEDIETALQLLIGDNQTIDCCEYNPECCDEIFDPMVQLTARIIIDARDGVANLISAWVQHNLIISQNRKGRFVRNVMEKMGVDVPTDVDNETLAELFKVRQRDLELVVEPVENYLNELLDIGISMIDVLAIVSPSKGAGAFIFAKTGTGTITAKALSDHLKTIANIASTTLSGGKGYKSFNAFKRAHGNASSGNALHHIVEQNGFQSLN